MMSSFGLHEYEMFLSTRPEKYAGTVSMWEGATGALKHVLEKLDLHYEVDPGEGVFYGPKIDIKLKDAIRAMLQGRYHPSRFQFATTLQCLLYW